MPLNFEVEIQDTSFDYDESVVRSTLPSGQFDMFCDDIIVKMSGIDKDGNIKMKEDGITPMIPKLMFVIKSKVEKPEETKNKIFIEYLTVGTDENPKKLDKKSYAYTDFMKYIMSARIPGSGDWELLLRQLIDKKYSMTIQEFEGNYGPSNDCKGIYPIGEREPQIFKNEVPVVKSAAGTGLQDAEKMMECPYPGCEWKGLAKDFDAHREEKHSVS